jgi:hypothetical protein
MGTVQHELRIHRQRSPQVARWYLRLSGQGTLSPSRQGRGGEVFCGTAIVVVSLEIPGDYDSVPLLLFVLLIQRLPAILLLLLQVVCKMLLLWLFTAVSSLSGQQLTIAEMPTVHLAAVVIVVVASVHRGRPAAHLLPLLLATGGELERGDTKWQPKGHHAPALFSLRPWRHSPRRLVGVALMKALESHVPETQRRMIVADVEEDLAREVAQPLGQGEARPVPGGLHVGVVRAREHRRGQGTRGRRN